MGIYFEGRVIVNRIMSNHFLGEMKSVWGQTYFSVTGPSYNGNNHLIRMLHYSGIVWSAKAEWLSELGSEI